MFSSLKLYSLLLSPFTWLLMLGLTFSTNLNIRPRCVLKLFVRLKIPSLLTTLTISSSASYVETTTIWSFLSDSVLLFYCLIFLSEFLTFFNDIFNHFIRISSFSKRFCHFLQSTYGVIHQNL